MHLLDTLELLPYQAAFAANTARFKIGLWARQTGKDHTCAFEAVSDSLLNPGALWIIVAAGERQALESLAKAQEWAETLRLQLDTYAEDRPSPQARIRSAEIRWANGSRLLALPANPQTIRGYSANIILTEFAFHENPGDIWRAIYPSISNPLRGGRKKLRIISTPNGPQNKFAQLWHNPGPYHKSLVTIHHAVAAGLPLNPAELQAGLDDPDAWKQEYLCQFADTSSVLLPYDLIESCESPEATDTLGPSDDPGHFSSAILRHGSSGLFAGIDFGRKRHLTVCWLLQRVNNRLVTREVLTLRNLPVPEQLRILRPRVQRCQQVAFDYTGPGIGLGDSLVQEFREHKPSSGQHGRVELCHFTPALKGELFPRLQAAFERRDLLIPPSRDIREDLHGLHRFVSESGQITYRAVSSPDGHSDRATALALALRAASHSPPCRVRPTIVGEPFMILR
jgi:phage FluMu gp28-like protein